MTSTVISDKSEYDPRNKSVIITVNNDTGNVTVDHECIHSILEGRHFGGIHVIQVGSSQVNQGLDISNLLSQNMENASLDSSASSWGLSGLSDMSVKSSSCNADPLSSLSLEDIQKLDAALHSEQAKQIFGEGLVDFLEANHGASINETPIIDSADNDSEREMDSPIIVSSSHALVDHCYFANNQNAEVRKKPKTDRKDPTDLVGERQHSKAKSSPELRPVEISPPSFDTNMKNQAQESKVEAKSKRLSRSSRRSIESIFKAEFEDEIFNEPKKLFVATHDDTKKRNKKSLESTAIQVKRDSEEYVPGKRSRRDSHVVDHENDEDSDIGEDVADDDPNKLWCICRKPHNNRFMICCDTCEDWFHGKCVGVSRQMGQQLEDTGKEWYCPNCRKDTKGPSRLPETKEIKKVRKESAVCMQPGCGEPALPNSIFCSVGCINQHAEDALVSLGLKKTRDKPALRDDVSIIVFERKTGKVLTGGSGPHANNLAAWLLDNPTFEVIKPTAPQLPKSIPPSPKARVARPTSSSVSSPVSSSSTPSVSTTPSSTPSTTPSATFSTPPAPPKPTKPKKAEQSPSIQIFDFPKLTPVKNLPVSTKEHNSINKNVSKVGSGSGNKSPASLDKPSPKLDNNKAISIGLDNDKAKENSRTAVATSVKSSVVNELSKKSSSTKDCVDKKSDSVTSDSGQIRISVKKTLKDALWLRYETSKLSVKLTEEDVSGLVDDIERELFDYFKDVGQKYKAKYRSLIFNIKDMKNGVLYKNILTKSIPPQKLVCLSPEELASRELAEWRERETKHQLDMIKKNELDLLERGSVFIAKTSDGETIIEADETGTVLASENDSKFIEEEKKLLSVNSDTTSQHSKHIYDINCMVCSGKMTKEQYRAKYVEKKKSRADRQESVDLKRPRSNRPSKSNSKKVKLKDKMRGSEVTGKVSKVQPVMKEYDTDGSTSTQGSGEGRLAPKPMMLLWEGIITMPDVSKFTVTAHLVSGLRDGITDDLPKTLEIVGRINPETVWDYIGKVKKSGTKEVVLVRFQTSSEEVPYLSFYAYLSSKNRFGVIGNGSSAIKDFYIFPLSSDDPLPDVLLPLNGPGFEDERPNLLLGLIVRQKRKYIEGSYRSYEGSYTPPLKTSGFSPDQFLKVDGNKETSTPSESRSYTPPLPMDGISFAYNGKKSNASPSSSPYSPGRSLAESPDPSAPYSPSENIPGDKYSQISDQLKLLDQEIAAQKEQLKNMSTACGETVGVSSSSPLTECKETEEAPMDVAQDDTEQNSSVSASRDPRDPRRTKKAQTPDTKNHSGSSSSASPPNAVFYQPYPPPSAPVTSSSEWNDNYISIPYKKQWNSSPSPSTWSKPPTGVTTWQAENGCVWKSCSDKDEPKKQWNSKKYHKARESSREGSWYH